MPNDNIMGIPTKACINGLTKEDTERLKNALIKKIVNDDTVIDITDDGKIIVADGDGLYLSFDGNILGLIKDSSGDYIPQTVPYLPEDENENPLAPPNDTIMTSANIAVDPRIVHTTGNETINGIKTFNNGINASPVGWYEISKQMDIGNYVIFGEVYLPPNNIDVRYIKIDLINSTTTVPAYASIIFRTAIDTRPRWINHTPFTTVNNPITATSIVFLIKDEKLYIAWKKEYTYGRIQIRVDLETNTTNVISKNNSYLTLYSTSDMVVTNDVSSYTVLQVE